MEAERDQRAFDDAVDGEGEGRLFVHSPIGEGLDPVTDRRPDETQHHSHEDDGKRSDDRDGAFPGEKSEIGRQLNPVEAVEAPAPRSCPT